MRDESSRNVLLVSNYPSDTAYAWWLMEHFWLLICNWAHAHKKTVFLAYPKITVLSNNVRSSKMQPVELRIPWVNKSEAKLVKAFLKENRIEMIYFVDQPFFSVLYFQMRCWGVKRIFVHDHTPGDRPPIGGLTGILKSLLNRISWATADLFINVSPLMRRRSLENGRIPGSKCVSVQNGVPIVQCAALRSDNIRHSLGVSPGAIMIVSSGRAHPYKRFDFIIETAFELRRIRPEDEFIFVLIGDGPAFVEMEAKIKKYGLQSHVLMLGFRRDVREILCASDIAIHASLGEGFSLSIVEYMSAGLPVLVPNIPSVSQAINDQKTGFIYPANDSLAAAGYIARLINDPQLRSELSAEARLVANSEFSIDNCTGEFNRVLESFS